MRKKFKKAMATFLSAAMILSAGPLTGFAALPISFASAKQEVSVNSDSVNGADILEFTDYEDGMVVSGVSDGRYYESLTVPATVNGKKVIGIIPDAFANCNISEIVISEGIEKIANSAFSGSVLEKIVLPDSIESIGYGAFYDVMKLQDPRTYGEFYIYCNAGSYAMSYCNDMYIKAKLIGYDESEFEFCVWGGDAALLKYNGTETETLTIPAKYGDYNVVRIEEHALQSCAAKEIVASDGIKYIGDNAFGGTTLEKVVLPDSIENIAPGAFDDVMKLQDPRTYGEFYIYCNAGSYAMSYCKDMYIKAKLIGYDESEFEFCVWGGDAALLKYNGTETETLTIPAKYGDCNVVRIEEYALHDCAAREIIVSEGIQYIGDNAFGGTTLEKVVLPDSIEKIAPGAFDDVMKLQDPRTYGEFYIYCNAGSYAMSCCKDMYIKVKLIGYDESDFEFCVWGEDAVLLKYNGTETSTLTIPAKYGDCNVVRIEEYALHDCAAREIIVSEGIQYIGDNAFGGTTLEKVVLPDSIEKIAPGAFDDVMKLLEPNVDGEFYIYCNAGSYAMSYCNDMYIKAKLIGYDERDFEFCIWGGEATLLKYRGTAVETLTIPAKYGDCNVVRIEEYALHDCAAREIIVSEGIQYIGDNAFGGTTLEKVVLPDSVEVIGYNAFYDVMKLQYPYTYGEFYIYCNAGSHAMSYCEDRHIKAKLIGIDESEFEFCIYGEEVALLQYNGTETEKLTIPAKYGSYVVTSIEEYALDNCNAKEIVIPGGIRYIGDFVFNKNVKVLSIPSSVDYIGLGFIPYDAQLECVYFRGTEEQWNATDYASHYAFESAKIIFDDVFAVSETSTLTVDNGVIYGADILNMTTDELAAQFENANVAIECSSKKIGTGTKINLLDDNGEVIDSITVVVFGDANGDGWYDGTDAVTVKLLANEMLTREQVGEAFWSAADCNHDGVIDELDVALLEQAGLILADVDQSKSTEELKTNSAYIEYLKVIDQNPSDENDAPTGENTGNSVFDIINNIINAIVEIIKQIFVFIPKF